jgi:hypothetical protein
MNPDNNEPEECSFPRCDAVQSGHEDVLHLVFPYLENSNRPHQKRLYISTRLDGVTYKRVPVFRLATAYRP